MRVDRPSAVPSPRRLAYPVTALALAAALLLGLGRPSALPADDAYVGDAACAACHAAIAETYARTNKARALVRFDAATAPERFDGAVVHDPVRRLAYTAFVRGDTLYQREFRVDAEGALLHERVHAAAYVIGSGNATRSYLMDAGGYLTEMPLTWYTDRAAWDLSPGYHEANDRFGRQINLQCITCHTGAVTHTRSTQNHYAAVGEGITCERCHGPGAAHAEARAAGARPEGADPTIVNPARLGRDARLAICQQCHLAGLTVFRPGEDPTTYRPGQPLAAHRTVFVPVEELTDDEAVGIDSHPLRLARSACYQQSAMTCGTCHDPHRPAELLSGDPYNPACQTCHASDDHAGGLCARPDAHAADAATGDCVGCHMRQGGTTNVPHVTFTDHWIRRRPAPPRDPDAGRPAFDRADPLRLVALQEEGRPAHILAPRATHTAYGDLERATAYWQLYETMHTLPAYLDSVRVAARRGLAGGADHVEARIALARALAEADSLSAALRVLDAARRAFPADPWVLFWLGAFHEARGDAEAAAEALERAVALQPHLIEAQKKLAEALLRSGRAETALARLDTVLARDPVHQPRAWYNKGILHLRLGQPGDAAFAFTESARLDPDLVDAHIQLGTLLLEQEAYEAAARRFYLAIVADPADPAGYGSLGMLFLHLGETDRARHFLERVLALDPDNPAARTLLEDLR